MIDILGILSAWPPFGSGSGSGAVRRSRIREAAVGAIKADPALAAIVGARVYPVGKPLGKATPAITYQVLSDRPDRTLDGPDGTRRARIRFAVAGKPEDLAEQIDAVEALRSLFDGFTGIMEGVEVDEVIQIEGDDAAEMAPESEAIRYTPAVEFLFLYRY